MECTVPVDPVENEVTKKSSEDLEDNIKECIGDCTAAVDLQRVLNDPSAILLTHAKGTATDHQSEPRQVKVDEQTPVSKAEAQLNDILKDLDSNENDKATMTDLEDSIDLELQRILEDHQVSMPPRCPDVPSSETESEDEVEIEESLAEVDVTSDLNLQHLKRVKAQIVSPQNSLKQDYFHLCAQCLKIPKDVLEDISEYAGIERGEARKAAFKVMQFLKTPQGTTFMNSVLTKEEKCLRTPPLPKRKLTKDEKVATLLRRLTRQRGAWAVFEDDTVVLPILANLNVLLEKMDSKLCKAALKKDQYRSVKNLVGCFEKEKRWSIRSEMLGLFDILATRDECALSVLMLSDLPVHLAFAIQNPHSDSECILSSECKCDEKTTLYAGMLTALLRSGDPMPSAHFDYLDADFVLYLLGKIESYRNAKRDNPMSFVYMNLVLALNIQFASSEVFENPVISALSIMPKLTMFKYKLMCYLTERDDALDVYKFETLPPYANSSMKLLEDVLGCMHTTNIFNVDEIKFIFETLLSHLLEVDSGHALRTSVLRNLRLLLCKLKYEHPKLRDLVKIFRGILRETSPKAKQDKKYVQEMINALSVYRLCTDVNTKFTTL